jgi:hypothetical protein
MRHSNGDDVTARAGLPLVLEAGRAIGLEELIEEKLHIAKRQRGFSELEKLEALVLLIASGGDRVEDIRILAEDKGLARLLGREFPSPDALLDFLKAFDSPEVWEAWPVGQKSFVPAETEPLAALFEVNRELVCRIARRQCTDATIDHDGTIIEAHRREAMVAYEGTRGFQPLLAVWAEQDLIVGDEFRDGNVPGNKDPLRSVKRVFEALPPWVTRRYFRGDSADYHEDLLKYLANEQILFAITADMSPELRKMCMAVPEEQWTLCDERAFELVQVAEVEFAPGNWPKSASPLRYVALRVTERQQEIFAQGPKYFAVVTNRPAPEEGREQRGALSAVDLVHWHRGKAGTIEHVHRTLKDELGAGVMPSGRFGANAAWLRINVLTYNLLTLLKQQALPAKYFSARPKRLRYEVFTLPGRLVSHRSQLSVDLSASPDRAEQLVRARQRLLELRREIHSGPAGLQ